MSSRSESKLLHVHIEKVGGTSMEAFLGETVGVHELLLWSTRNKSLVRASDSLRLRTNKPADTIRRVLNNTPFAKPASRIYRFLIRYWSPEHTISSHTLPKNFSAIHGHFCADQFDNVLEKPVYATMTREPLERAFSHYNHWKRYQGGDDWRVTIPYDPQLTFEEFALSEALINYQTQALGSVEISRFAVVGVTENIDAYTHKLFTLAQEMKITTAKRLPKVEKLNSSSTIGGRHKITSSPFVSEFRKRNDQDYQLYSWCSKLG